MATVEVAMASMGGADRRIINNLYKQAMLEGAALERLAEQYRQEAEQAYEDVGLMKAEGRRRVAGERGRMLPQHQRATDVRTNTFKAVADAKGDNLYLIQLSQMYAGLAAMKFAKAAGLKQR